jgi:alpha-galactosidase
MSKFYKIDKLIFISFLTCWMIFSSFINKPVAIKATAEMKIKSIWVKEHLLNTDPILPFSFIYDGKPSSELFKTWQKKNETNKLDDNRTQYTHIWTDAKTGLEVRCVAVEYTDYSVVEWTVYLKNTGTKSTPILKDIQGLDAKFGKSAGGEFVLHGNKGDWNVAESYEPYMETLCPNSFKRFAPNGGRPTNGPDGWPYFNLQMPGGGVIIAVGWPGQWAGTFERDERNGVQIVAGQELTYLCLKPGEEIRTPLIALQFWQGNEVAGAQNLWRRWMMAHNLPRTSDSKPPVPMYIFCDGGFFPGLKVSEAIEKQFIDTLTRENIKIDYWWMDAGWYQCGESWPNTGTWEYDKTRFPNGIKAVSDYIHTRSMKLILWFEPERVGDKNSWLAKNHPEWLLGEKLLNLGNPDVLKWATEHFSEFITEQGIDLYRQDFNIDPLNFWRANDSLDRQGITENFYVQGYLAYWDELRRQHPGMLIDACASGGRRNDLETMRRAVPLLRSDYQSFDGNPGFAAGNQGHTYGISSWFPYFGQNVYKSTQYMTYYVRSHMSPCFGICIDVRKPGIDWDEYRLLASNLRKVADCMLGDYYPLTPYSLKLDQWIAWQFDRPKQGDGIIQAFRRNNSDEQSKTFHLRGLNPSSQYEVTNCDVPGSMKVSGKELIEKGLTVVIKDKPWAMVISYKVLK